MARISRITTFLLAGAALPMLAACGASDIASPGDGTVIGGGGTPTPTPPTSPPVGPNQAPTGALSTVSAALADLVNSRGFTDEGVIEFGATAGSTGSATSSAAVTGFRIIRVPSLIDANVTLPYVRGVAYLIDGETNVGTDRGGAASGGLGVTLTVQPGVIVFADNGATGTLNRVTVDSTGTATRTAVTSVSSSGGYNNRGPDFLIVNRGSKIVAEGTATRPIIFTARQNLEGTAVDTGLANSQGFWGGIILAGRAPISDCQVGTDTPGTAACYKNVEGTAASRYGGGEAADSSGSLRYVQIRYSGILVSANNELQGLTPAGAGSGTTLDHIQVHNSADDGIEIFGGRVNAKNLIITGSDDDDLDTDYGYQGAIQFVIGVKREGNGSSDPRNLEGDSNANREFLPRQYLRLANFTFVHPGTASAPANAVGLFLRGGMDATIVNGIVKTTNAATACVDIDHAETIRADVDATLEERGAPVFRSIYFDCAAPYGGTNENVTATQIAALFSANNNVTNGSGSLLNNLLAQGAAATTTAFDASTLNRTGETFLVNTTYIGAIRDANDNWYKGWTCTPAYLTALGGLGACTAIPTYS